MRRTEQNRTERTATKEKFNWVEFLKWRYAVACSPSNERAQRQWSVWISLSFFSFFLFFNFHILIARLFMRSTIKWNLTTAARSPLMEYFSILSLSLFRSLCSRYRFDIFPTGFMFSPCSLSTAARVSEQRVSCLWFFFSSCFPNAKWKNRSLHSTHTHTHFSPFILRDNTFTRCFSLTLTSIQLSRSVVRFRC